MVIAKVPAPALTWVVGELLNGNALSWCGRWLVQPADLRCPRCGAETEAISLAETRGARAS